MRRWSFRSILCWKRNRARGPYNEIRILELALCLVSFSLSFYFISTGILPVPMFLALFCMVGVIFILLVDIVVTTTWFPIGWRAWILVSLSSALYFFTCTGLSFIMMHKYYYVGSIFFLLTAIVFLVDGLCIIWLVRRPEDTVSRVCGNTCRATQIVPINRPYEIPVKPPEVSDNTQQTFGPTASCRLLAPKKGGNRPGTSGAPVPEPVRKVSYSQEMPSALYSNKTFNYNPEAESICPFNYNPSSSAGITHSNPRSAHTCSRQLPVMTHGGTFHVSKDVVPMPSAEVNESSPKCISEPEIFDSVEIEETDCAESRSVAIMIRMLPKNLREIDLTPLKSPFDRNTPPETSPKQPTVKRVKSVQCLACKPCKKMCMKSKDRQSNENVRSSPTKYSQQFYK